jgi:CMP/dCMP kinase
MTIQSLAPVITIDGPTASGKGTVAARVAQALGMHLLDSGALYRLTGLAADAAGVSADDADGLGRIAAQLDVRFDENGQIWLAGREVSAAIRAESAGNMASRVAVHRAVRQALVERQRAFRQAPGLVADGRDMGTVIFPDAPLKVFLTASVEARAQRRHKQLIEKGFPANLAALSADLRARDERDTQRADAPLKPAEDAHLLDTSQRSIDETVAQVLAWWAACQPRA